MPSSASISFTFHADEATFQHAATNAVKNMGFQLLNSSASFKHLTATFTDKKVAGRDSFVYKYSLEIEWHSTGGSVHGTIVVQEDGKRKQQACQAYAEKCNESISTLLARHTPPALAPDESQWATAAELEEKGYLTDAVLPKQILVGSFNDRYLAIPEVDSMEHAFVCGPTGTRKTTAFFIPNILERLETNMIITEATETADTPPDIFTRTAGARQNAGHKIFTFTPGDLNSTPINPLDMVRLAAEQNQIAAAQSLAAILVANSANPQSKSDPIWDKSERLLLTPMILHVATMPDPSRAHFATVRNLLMAGPDFLALIMKDSHHEIARYEFMAWYNNAGEGFARGVTSGLQTKLDAWLTPQVATITAETHPDLSLDQIGKSLFTFYFSVPAHQDELKPLAALIFNYLLTLTSQLKSQYPLTLLLDEFTNFGYIPKIANRMTIIRRAGVSVCLGFQDYMQLEKVYGKADAEILFAMPGTRIFYTPRSEQTARLVASKLGQRTKVEIQIQESGAVHRKETKAFLMDSSILSRLDRDSAIVFLPTANPVVAQKFPYNLYDLLRLPAPERTPLPINWDAYSSCRKLVETTQKAALQDIEQQTSETDSELAQELKRDRKPEKSKKNQRQRNKGSASTQRSEPRSSSFDIPDSDL